jgi:hypothetical protein
MMQAQFLQQWGIDELVREGNAYWEQLTGAPDVAAIKMRSRAVEQGALTDMAGLGGLTCIRWNR